MERTHRDKWLITWDTLSRQAAKKEGRHEPIRIVRPRTIIYLGVLLVAMIGMTAALLTRSTLGLSVLRDRAPVFVPLADGSLRNGYTVKIANKTQVHAAFDLSSRWPAGRDAGRRRGRSEAGAGAAPAQRLRRGRHVPRAGHRSAGRAGDGSQPVDFVLRDTVTGEQTVYHSTFMGPPGYAATRAK